MIVAFWQLIVLWADPPTFIFPAPSLVFYALIENRSELIDHLAVTALEVALGGVISIIIGSVLALTLAMRASLRGWLFPILAASQALPVFAIAPMLVLWLGYGLASKVVMTIIILFFPVVTAFYDGILRISKARIDMAMLMASGTTNAKARVLIHIILPSALPALASGLRITATLAPLGAVVGEWVGSSAGLGYYILHTSARNQVPEMFSALALLMLASLTLYSVTDYMMKRLCNWSEAD